MSVKGWNDDEGTLKEDAPEYGSHHDRDNCSHV